MHHIQVMRLMIKVSVSIDVPDLSAGEAFYAEALGCSKVRDQGNNMRVLSADNADIYLLKREPGSLPVRQEDRESSIIRNYERHWTPVHLDFLCNDVDSVVARIIAAGGSHEGGESGDWGSIAHCADPFGNGFCVINE